MNGLMGLQKLITDLDMKNGYKGGVQGPCEVWVDRWAEGEGKGGV
jgi:hypothetical protein